jgi:hypothetical protein
MRFICSSALAATAIVWSFRSNVPVEAFVPTSTTTPIHKSAVLTTRIQNNAAPHHCHHRRHVNAAKRFRLLTYQGFGFNNDSVSETATNNHDFIMDSAMAGTSVEACVCLMTCKCPQTFPLLHFVNNNITKM